MLLLATAGLELLVGPEQRGPRGADTVADRLLARIVLLEAELALGEHDGPAGTADATLRLGRREG